MAVFLLYFYHIRRQVEAAGWMDVQLEGWKVGRLEGCSVRRLEDCKGGTMLFLRGV